MENRVTILAPPRHLDAHCAYKYVNNLLTMNMKQWKLLPELNGNPVYCIILFLTTVQGKCIEINKDSSNNINAFGLEDNVTGATISNIKVRYVIPSDTKEVFIIQDIIASELLQCKYRVISDTKYDKYRIVELEAHRSSDGKLSFITYE